MILIVLICVYIILGFMLAWIAAMVAKEEVEVKTGVLTLFCAGILSMIANYGLAQVVEDGVLQLVLGLAVQFFILAVCLKAIAKLEWKHCFIIAAIYDLLLFLISLAFTSCEA